METRAHHVLIGAFTLIVAAFALLFALWLAKYSTEKSWNEYDVVFEEAVTGLSNGSLVQYNGITVGEVRELSLAPKDPSKVIARIRVKAGTPVKVDTEARLAFIGLTGVAQISLTGGTATSAPLKPENGRKVGVLLAKESAFQKLLNSSDDIATSASRVLTRLNAALSEENVAKLSATLGNLEQVTGTLAGQREDIRLLIASAREASERLKGTLTLAESSMQKLDAEVIGELPETLDRLNRTIAQLERLSKNANDTLEQNREAIDSFGNQGLAQVGPTLAELRSVLRDLNQITSKLEENPAAFVLGKDREKEFKP